MKRLLLLITCALLASSVACSEPARRPVKVAPAEATTPVAAAPAWTRGEFPEGKLFWGTAHASIEGSEADAKAAATKKAAKNLQAEVALLVNHLNVDHEEQVAEIVTRYSLEEFSGHIDGSVATALEQTQVVETWVDKGRTPKRLYVLVSLNPDAIFAAIYAREGLPDEQKNRVKDYEDLFRDSAMSSLSR